MAIGLRQEFPENVLNDYDSFCKALNFPAEWPDGLLAHSSHESDGHMVVNDVWESRQHFDRFVEDRLQQAIGQALGDRARPPKITESQLHTFYAAEVRPT